MKNKSQLFLILNSVLLFLIFFFYFTNLSPYKIPFLFFILIGIIGSVMEFTEYYNKLFLISISALILLLMWITIFLTPISTNANLLIYYLESILITVIIILFLIYNPKEWEKNIKALEPYNRALELNPHDTTALNNKGVELAVQRKFNKAKEYFDEVLKIDPEDAVALNNKSIVMDRFQRNRKARKIRTKAFKIDPGLENAANSGKLILEIKKTKLWTLVVKREQI